jgi:hypothetical protein
MMEGSGSGARSVLLTNGSECGSGGPRKYRSYESESGCGFGSKTVVKGNIND